MRLHTSALALVLSLALWGCARPDDSADSGGLVDWDRDGDSYFDGEDCDDLDESVHPGAEEHCDGIDEDCDGQVDEDAVDAQEWFLDADGDAHGDPEQSLWACEAPEGYVADSTDCDDDEPLAHPDMEEICEDLIDNDCDGTSNECPPEGELSLAEAELTLLGTTRYGLAGWSLLGGADLDADGYDDLVVGSLAGNADWGDAQRRYAGAVYVFRGPLAAGERDVDTADARILSLTGGDRAGMSLAAGDLDEDGVADLIVGAPGDVWRFEEGGEPNEDAGEVFLFTGEVSGEVSLRGGASAHLLGSVPDGHAGYALASIERAGGPVLAVGAPDTDASTGTVYLVEGPLAGERSLSEVGTTLRGTREAGMAGSVIVNAGDQDGDGWDDLLVAAPGDLYSLLGTLTPGSVSLFLDLPSGEVSLADADVTWTGAEDGSLLGQSLAGEGDVNGDGYDDLLLGAGRDDTAGEGAGAVWLLLGPVSGGDLSETAEAVLYGEQAGDGFGISASIHGDMDADGREDVVVGAWTAPEGANTGVSYLFIGPVQGSLSASDARASWVGARTGQASGYPALWAGDVDADGYDDLALGASYDATLGDYAGAAYVIFGTGL